MTGVYVGLLDESMLGEAEVAAIHLLRQQLKPTATPVTFEYLQQLLACGSTQVFVAVIEHQIVGVALLCSVYKLDGRRDQLEELVVFPDYRKYGIGRELLKVVVEASYVQGARDISLTTELAKRPEAVALYETNGFTLLSDKVVLRRPHY